MLTLLLLACGAETAPEATVLESPLLEVGVVPAPELIYVQASRLALRDAPEGGVRRSLGINTRLRVLERGPSWVQVTAPDGTGGWVHGDFVATERITLEALRAELGSTEDPQQVLALSQRAAALAPTDAEVLEELAAAYEGVADVEAAAKVRRAMAATLERFDGWFPTQKNEADAIRVELAAVDDAAAFMALWERARQLTAAMGGALNSRYDYDDMGFVGGNPEPLFQERMPYVALNFYAEGTHAELELATQAWSQAASRTPETWDDAFIQLLVESYGNAEGRGWAAWQARNWDYGGCSPLGSGLHKDLLLQTDALAGRAVIAEPVGRIRGAVLGDIEQRRGPGEFPYCGGPNLDATPVEALQAEALQILAEVTLSDAERSMIEARVTAGFAGD